MESLNVKLKAQIADHPTETVLRTEKEDVNKAFTDISIINVSPSPRNVDIPDNFDGRIVWSGLLTPPMNQGTCSSCWAFASTSVLSDRFNIQSMGMMYVILSPTKLILCNFQGKELDFDHPEENIFEISKVNTNALSNSACYGNSLVDACRYLYQIGTSTEDCIPYTKKLGIQSDYQKIGTFEKINQLPLCATVSGIFGDMCSDFYNDVKVGVEGGTPARFYKAYHYYSIAGIEKDGGSEKNIRDNIYKWGPVASAIKLYPDFHTFDTKKIYEWDGQGPSIGGHAIEIVGWGIEDKKKFWIVKNSWGVEWGDGGFFRIARGNNMCEIEANCIGMVPDFFYPINYIVPGHELLRENKKIKEGREKIYKHENTAGGIDPLTGYTRRVMIEMPWLVYTPPVEWENLPNWNTFIAGKDATVDGRARYLKKRNSKYKIINYLLFILGIGMLFIFFLLIATYLKLKFFN